MVILRPNKNISTMGLIVFEKRCRPTMYIQRRNLTEPRHCFAKLVFKMKLFKLSLRFTKVLLI